MCGFHLRHLIVSYQALDDPRFFQFPHRTLIAVEAQDRRLCGRLVHLQHAHAQARQLPNLSRRRITLKAIEQFELPLPYTCHYRRKLPPTPERTCHRFFCFGIGQAITSITLP
jgi:hypothetical protein